GAERHAGDLTRVALERELLLSGVGVPHVQGLVLAAGEDAAAVGAERHAADSGRVSREGEQLEAAVSVPHLQGVVSAAREDAPAAAITASGAAFPRCPDTRHPSRSTAIGPGPGHCAPTPASPARPGWRAWRLWPCVPPPSPRLVPSPPPLPWSSPVPPPVQLA